ncbi:hypothetical protein G4B88_010506 [Cannabis sativa]|uniref:FAR1 domain-containing protein n=1 Tax=Cannabis sativa TaxID=3483 RepID=A0A7J6I654_CANSA|nr:hypothetical protein G4B88_010506 [Cannabis sativa]
MVEFEEVEDYYENGMEESLELEYELTQPKIEDEVIEHEMNENELVAWKIMLNFLSITKEPELINESDRRGKEFLYMEQAEEFYTLYSKVIGFSVRKKNKKAQHGRDPKWFLLENRKRDPRYLTRTGCQASFKICRNATTGRW